MYYDSLEEASKAPLYVPMQTYYNLVEYRKNINTFHPPQAAWI